MHTHQNSRGFTVINDTEFATITLLILRSFVLAGSSQNILEIATKNGDDKDKILLWIEILKNPDMGYFLERSGELQLNGKETANIAARILIEMLDRQGLPAEPCQVYVATLTGLSRHAAIFDDEVMKIYPVQFCARYLVPEEARIE